MKDHSVSSFLSVQLSRQNSTLVRRPNRSDGRQSRRSGVLVSVKAYYSRLRCASRNRDQIRRLYVFPYRRVCFPTPERLETKSPPCGVRFRTSLRGDYPSDQFMEEVCACSVSKCRSVTHNCLGDRQQREIASVFGDAVPPAHSREAFGVENLPPDDRTFSCFRRFVLRPASESFRLTSDGLV